jgi:rSAM/selenodomain-associated transferase 1
VRRYPVALRAQRGTTLGERLAFAAVGAFHQSDAVILIGTDCPVLTQVHLQSAAAALADYDAVIHPAEDGGYALLGLARPCPEAFVEIDWGSDRVFHQTMGRLASARMRVSVKETLWDVDTPTDLERLVRAMPEWADTTSE